MLTLENGKIRDASWSPGWWERSVILPQLTNYLRSALTVAHARVTYPSLSKGGVVQRLKEALVVLEKKLPVARIVLFGSYATGRYTADSDIDVLVVYTGAERPDAYKLVVDCLRLPHLEPHVYTQEQFDAMIRVSPKFAKAIASEGIWITGMEKESWSSEVKTG